MEIPVNPNNDDPIDDTPRCHICSMQVGLNEDGYASLRGQWMYSMEYDQEIFVLDPDTELVVIELPNQQLALVPDQAGHPTHHIHKDCYEFLTGDAISDDEHFPMCSMEDI